MSDEAYFYLTNRIRKLLAFVDFYTKMYRIKLIILVLGFGLGPHMGPRPNKYFFLGEKSAY